jgi:hypothetical protein
VTQYSSNTNTSQTQPYHRNPTRLQPHQLTIAPQGNIPTGNKTAEALQKSQQAIHQNSNGKHGVAKAKTMRSRVCATQAAQQATHIPRVAAPIPRVETPIPRVTEITEAHCTQAVTPTQHKDRCKLTIVTNPPVPQQIA